MSGDFVGQNKTVTVAKGHYCHGCGRWCERGENMRYQSGKRNGAFYSRYWCMDCYTHSLANPLKFAVNSIANDFRNAWDSIKKAVRG